jgi:ergothioneine biosynthesis protein EgtB
LNAPNVYSESDQAQIIQHFCHVREVTRSLCDGLSAEDMNLQSMPDVSPLKWHLAHTTWFFETFLLAQFNHYRPFNPAFRHLFNSYYVSVGERFARPLRSLLSRPSLNEVLDYRQHVEQAVVESLHGCEASLFATIKPILELGIHHEQQHQELMITDLKHSFSINPLGPVYRDRPVAADEPLADQPWLTIAGGLYEIGWSGDGFCFDNETPRHRQWLDPFMIASRLVTNAEMIAFINAGGYQRPELWLSDGWVARTRHGWQAPEYWYLVGDTWYTYTLAGRLPVALAEPVCHVSYYEADAYARWAGARLPTEAEWEVVAQRLPIAGHFLESGLFHPQSVQMFRSLVESADQQPVQMVDANQQPLQMFGDVWEWTASPYTPYPRYQPLPGSLGEYNGKFMCNQFVLRGGSCATPQSHIRPTYRNFFPPEARWQFTGIRLARNV